MRDEAKCFAKRIEVNFCFERGNMYLYPDMPVALEGYLWDSIDPSLCIEDVVACYQSQSKGNYKECIVFEMQGFYFRNKIGKPYFVWYADIVELVEKHEDKKKYGKINKLDITLRDGNVIPFMVSGVDKESMKYTLISIKRKLGNAREFLSLRKSGKIEHLVISEEKKAACRKIIKESNIPLSAIVGSINGGLPELVKGIEPFEKLIEPIEREMEPIGNKIESYVKKVPIFNEPVKKMITRLGREFDINLTVVAVNAFTEPIEAYVKEMRGSLTFIPIVRGVQAYSYIDDIGWLAVQRFAYLQNHPQNKFMISKRMLNQMDNNVLLSAFNQLNEAYKEIFLEMLTEEGQEKLHIDVFYKNLRELYDYLFIYGKESMKEAVLNNGSLFKWNLDKLAKRQLFKGLDDKCRNLLKRSMDEASVYFGEKEAITVTGSVRELEIYSKNIMLLLHNKLNTQKGEDVHFESVDYVWEDFKFTLKKQLKYCKMKLLRDAKFELLNIDVARHTYLYCYYLVFYLLNTQGRM